MMDVFSSGGGTQSTAIAALIVQGRLPKPDFVVIADTGRERSTTWKYMDEVTAPALASVGVEVHRPTKEEFSYAHQDLRSNNGNTLLIPAYTDFTGEKGKLPGFCSKTWKLEVIQNFLRRKHGLKRADYRFWIGFSLDEATRAVRMMGRKEYKAGLIRFPLFDDVPMRRQQAIDLVVREMGWPLPPRSACWMCPNQSDAEWRDLKENLPGEFDAACRLDEKIREKDPDAFLHSSCAPLREVDFYAQGDLFQPRPCDSGVCFL